MKGPQEVFLDVVKEEGSGPQKGKASFLARRRAMPDWQNVDGNATSRG